MGVRTVGLEPTVGDAHQDLNLAPIPIRLRPLAVRVPHQQESPAPVAWGFLVVGRPGLEPGTCGLRVRCSAN